MKRTFLRRIISEPRWAIRSAWRLVMSLERVAKNREVYRLARTWTFGRAPRLRVTEVFPGIESIGVTIHRALDRTEGTSLSGHEILVLSSIARFIDAHTILEIGTFDGNTALNLASNTPKSARIFTVDLPLNWNGDLAVAVPERQVNVTSRARVGWQFKGMPEETKIDQIFSDSALLDWDRLPVPLDLVFIDGCHAYQYVKLDTEKARAHLKRGGLVIWHDYGLLHDVSKAVDEAGEEIRVVAILGTRLAVGFVD